MAASAEHLSGLAALDGRHDALLLDQWGVLHDGHQPYPGVHETLARLAAAGTRLLLLSNTARREADNLRMLAGMGFDTACFEGVMTAGDDARDALRSDAAGRALGRRCLPLSRPNERFLAEGVGFELVDTVAEADWLFLLSMEPPQQSLAAWRALLDDAAARRLPMVCANPDFERVTLDGTRFEAPGRVAQHYASLGGPVHWHGKPHGRIYRRSLARLGLPAARVLAVGDSLAHDVAGAATAGVACAWVSSGVHAAEAGQPLEQAACERLFEETGVTPAWVLPRFAW